MVLVGVFDVFVCLVILKSGKAFGSEEERKKAGKKRQSARWYFLHTFGNLLVVIFSLESIAQVGFSLLRIGVAIPPCRQGDV